MSLCDSTEHLLHVSAAGRGDRYITVCLSVYLSVRHIVVWFQQKTDLPNGGPKTSFRQYKDVVVIIRVSPQARRFSTGTLIRVLDDTKVTIECEYEVICYLLNGVISNNLHILSNCR